MIKNGNLIQSGSYNSKEFYTLSENGRMIADQLETTLAHTVKEKAYACAVKLLAEKKTERENSVEIIKTENGFNVICKISGGDIDLFTFTLYAPSFEQAMMIKKNFYESPSTVYKVMLALLTKDKDNVGEALEELYSVL